MRYLVIVLVCFVVSACGASKIGGIPFSSLEPPSAQQAVLYFYRLADESAASSRKEYAISIDGDTVGTLHYGEYFRRVVNAGRHHIESDYPFTGSIAGMPFVPLMAIGNAVTAAAKKPEVLDLDVNPGETKFVKLHSEAGFFNIVGQMTMMPEATATSEMRATNRVP